MRDLLPPVARRQGELARRVTRCFELHGYEIVTLPVFEYAEVLERGLGALDSDEVLRFVEPESGEVVALRPDMTPQIARILATRLADLPARRGSVTTARSCAVAASAPAVIVRSFRRGSSCSVWRARRAIWRSCAWLRLACAPRACRRSSSISATRASPPHSWRRCPRHARPSWSTRWRSKISPRSRAARLAAGYTGRTLTALSELCELHGGSEIWPRAERLLAGTAAEGALRELRQIWDAVSAAELAPKLLVDLSETRNFAYYTGLMFQIHADGPGSPIGAGGRYDSLLGRFGAPRAAAGFALSLDHLAWALESIGREESNELRLLTVGASEALLTGLRNLGVPCAESQAAVGADALAYARAWRFSHVLEVGASGVSLINVVDEQKRSVLLEPEALVSSLGQLPLGSA